MDIKLIYGIAAVISLLLTVLLCRYIIPKLKSIKMGQKILDIGPRWHKSKEGTPTMGGIAFIIAILLSLIVAAVVALIFESGFDSEEVKWVVTVFGYALLNAVIGAVDDVAKFMKKQNEGLTAPQKYLLQLVAAAAFLLACRSMGLIATEIYFPYFDYTLVLSGVWKILYYMIMLLLLTGMVNSVNLTDGIDGLSSSVTAVVGVLFSVFAVTAARTDISMLSGALVGGCIGFLVYNFHPARVFMGDTGSLFLGGFIVALAFAAGNPLIILLCGLVYVIETASVILQVAYFKLTHGRRLFKMSPIHHHFEQCGWNEVKIVVVFTIAAAVFCAVSYFGFAR